MLKEKEVIEKVKQQIRRLLPETELATVEDYRLDNKRLVDLVCDVKTKAGKKYEIWVEAKSQGLPRNIRSAVSQLNSYLKTRKDVFGLIVAPFLSEESRQICIESGLNYLDLSGNCLLKLPDIYIKIDGKPNKYPSTRPLRSVFSPKSTRLLRVLLNDVRKSWYVKDLAKSANLSLGQVSNLKKQLLDYDYLRETNEGKLQVKDPECLLMKWAEKYDYTKNRIESFYSLDNIGIIENLIANKALNKGVQYAFTLTSGSIRVAPFLRSKRVFVYIDSDLYQFAKECNFKKVDSGANVILMKPYDKGVFYFKQEINGADVVSDVQLYLDLITYKERGQEAAEFILTERLRKSW
ncbi:MAG: hypothetical protein KAW56_13580 [Candidatus Marinimicrobia bacterium]|nr:hypothetical protein [Candidatus Neomarinimicrobiota bacterium]